MKAQPVIITTFRFGHFPETFIKEGRTYLVKQIITVINDARKPTFQVKTDEGKNCYLVHDLRKGEWLYREI